MASLIFAHAKQITKKCEKLAARIADTEESLGKNWKDSYNSAYAAYMNSELRQFEKYLQVAKELHSRYSEICGSQNRNGYFITIRPNELAKERFLDFKEKVEAFVNRASFLRVTYSFEQKGTTPSEVGIGYHAHLVIHETKMRSKGEVLRATLSSWNDWIESGLLAANCIDVQTTKNPDTIVEKYLIAYESDDQHKESTKSMDELWRSTEGLSHIYTKE